MEEAGVQSGDGKQANFAWKNGLVANFKGFEKNSNRPVVAIDAKPT